ncbi:MAG: TldD/PmbA family protein [Prolixibacteraceae bacterium]
MTKAEKYKLAKWAMEHALKNGAQQSSVSISDSKSSSIDIRDEKIDKLETSIENGLSIELYVDHKYSKHSTNRLVKEELARFIEQAIEGTRYLSEDEFRALPDPSLYYKGDGPDLNTYDPQIDQVEPETKIEIAKALEKEVLGKDERIISVTTSYYDGESGRVMVTSNGFEGDYQKTYFGVGASVSVQSGDSRPSAGWYESKIHFDKLNKTGAGAIALDKALQKVGQKKIGTEKLPMLVENRQLGRLLGPVISALNGSAIQQKDSFLIDKLGQKVVSEKLSIIDDPFLPSGNASKLFDGEGLATKKRNIITQGVLNTYFIDNYYANKMGAAPTGGSTSNLVFDLGDQTMDEMISNIKRGILVTGFNGGNCNGTTGDFSYGIEGFLIEDGARTQAISEMNITGNMLVLWSSINAVGNDAYENSSWLTPSVLFNDVDFSGI